jgi:hypothetical protein
MMVKTGQIPVKQLPNRQFLSNLTWPGATGGGLLANSDAELVSFQKLLFTT